MKCKYFLAIALAGIAFDASHQIASKCTASAMFNSSSTTQRSTREVTILVDHYRPPCVNLKPKLCYLVAREETPTQYPYFYGEIQGFKYQWGHEYKLRVVEERTSTLANEYTYRLVEVLSDRKTLSKRTFSLQLKLPLGAPFYQIDDPSGVSLIGGVKIKFSDQKLKAQLVSLHKSAGSVEFISGDFKHDQKEEGEAIILTRIYYEKR